MDNNFKKRPHLLIVATVHVVFHVRNAQNSGLPVTKTSVSHAWDGIVDGYLNCATYHLVENLLATIVKLVLRLTFFP